MCVKNLKNSQATRFSSCRRQLGYLIEIPILLMIIGIVLSVLVPNVSPTGQKILTGIAAIPVLFGLYYMIVIPGWMPGNKGRLKPPWNVLVFLLVAAPIIAGIAMFLLKSATPSG